MTHNEQFARIVGALDLSPSRLARLVIDLGVDGDAGTMERRIRRWLTGEARVPVEAVALVLLLTRVRQASASLAEVFPLPP